MAKTRKSVSDRINRGTNPLFELNEETPDLDAGTETTVSETPEETQEVEPAASKSKTPAKRTTTRISAKTTPEAPKTAAKPGRKNTAEGELRYKKKTLKKGDIDVLDSKHKRSSYILTEPLIMAMKFYSTFEDVDNSQIIRGALIDAIPDKYLKMAIDAHKE